MYQTQIRGRGEGGWGGGDVIELSPQLQQVFV